METDNIASVPTDRRSLAVLPVDWAHTSAGPVELPMRFHDTGVVAAFFSVGAADAAPLIAELGFAPVSVAGRSIASLVFYDYRASTMGPYREVGLAVLATPRGRLTLPAWVVINLPVTAVPAAVAGCEIWGYPKFVTRIDHVQEPAGFSGAVHDPQGGLVCCLQGAPGAAIRIPSFTLSTFTRLGGRIVRTDVRIQARLRAHRAGSLRVRVGDSPHPMTSNLRALRIAGRAPVVALAATDMRVVLPRGRLVGPVQASE